MSLSDRLTQALRLPTHVLLLKALYRARQRWGIGLRRLRDARRETYAGSHSLPTGPVSRLLDPPPPDILRHSAEEIRALAHLVKDHRFDLLGSGWVQVEHGMECRGVETHRYLGGRSLLADRLGLWLEGRVTPANLPEAQRTWGLISGEYRPIDWHLDFKSGFRWSETSWYADVQYGHSPGVDIKVPWELSRLQHLPLLALAHHLEATHPAAPEIWAREFQNQVLDFIATNPPQYGVNWASAMDVAIRAANLLVANDLFSAANVDFHPQFQAVFRRTIVEHGRHIVDNLEWDPSFRGNHYLANIAGLLFIAAYLPRSGETDAWLAFAIQELKGEAAQQFLADGANFEASTSYHRLSGEMLVYSTAVVLGLTQHKKAALREYEHHRWKRRPRLRRAPITMLPLPGGAGESPFSALHFERLERAAEFTLHLSKPSGRVAQIGDNDSGRFLKVLPPLRRCTVAQARARWANLDDYAVLADDAPYWEEEHLDHRPFIAAVHGLLERGDFVAISSERSLDAWLVSRFARGRRVRPYPKSDGSTAAERWVKELPGTLDQLEEKLVSFPGAQRRTIELTAPGDSLRDGLVLYAYPLFGSYIFRSRRLFLAVRCGPIGQGGLGGHAHNDQLSMEVTLDGEDWVADPGSYLYTALPDRRNQYRSMWAHFGPRFASGEYGSLELGLFRLGSESEARCLHFSPAGFAGVLQSRRGTTHSVVRIGTETITVEYFCVGDRLNVGADTNGRDWKSGLPAVPFSPGYGIITRASADVSPLQAKDRSAVPSR